MKRQITVLTLAAIALYSFAPARSVADASQGGALQIALMTSNITVGEPLVLKYKITNPNSQLLNVNINSGVPNWLNMSLTDSAGHSVQFIPDADRLVRQGGVSVSPGSSYQGYFVVGRKLEPTKPGQYTLDVSAHMISSWPDKPSENLVTDQSYSLSVTVTPKDPKRLHATAEVFRQDVLRDKDLEERRAATKALFSMPEPECQSVWRELAVDPKLDAFSATDVINQLAAIETAGTSDILSDMDAVAPERWSRTGTSPSSALINMRQTAGPELKQHIDVLLAGADIPGDNKQLGEVN